MLRRFVRFLGILQLAFLLRVAPAAAGVSILWDDAHDSDSDELSGNFSNFRDLVLGAGHEIEELEGLPGALVPAALVRHSVFLTQDAEGALTPSEIQTLEHFIADGRLLVLWGEEPSNFNEASANQLLAPFGVSFSSMEIIGPGLLDFFEPDLLTTGLTAVNLSNTGTLLVGGAGTRVLGRINSSSHIGYAWGLDGRLLVLADASAARDTQIEPGNQNELLILNLLDHLESLAPTPDPCAQSFVVDFECIDGSPPGDDLALGDQLFASLGVRFRLDVDGDGFPDPDEFPLLEASGSADGGTPEDSGFENDALAALDTPAAGQEMQFGSFFLRLDRGGSARPLVISYSTPVTSASGEIWDIDGGPGGSEQWRVEAMGANYAAGSDPNDAVASIDSPLGDVVGQPLDGKPWIWSFDRGSTASIHAVRIRFIGTRTDPPGAGFDNLSPSSAVGAQAIPALNGLVVLCLAALIAAGAVWMRRA